MLLGIQQQSSHRLWVMRVRRQVSSATDVSSHTGIKPTSPDATSVGGTGGFDADTTVAWICHTSTQKISQHNRNFSQHNSIFPQHNTQHKNLTTQHKFIATQYKTFTTQQEISTTQQFSHRPQHNGSWIQQLPLRCDLWRNCCVVKNSCCVVRFSVWRCGRFMPPYNSAYGCDRPQHWRATLPVGASLRGAAARASRGTDPPAGPQATRKTRANPARNALGWGSGYVSARWKWFLCYRHTLHALCVCSLLLHSCTVMVVSVANDWQLSTLIM